MDSHRRRVSYALPAALLVAVLLKFGLIDFGALSTTDEPAAGRLWHTVLQTLAYGLPLAALAVAATEFLRLRRVEVHVAIGLFVTIFAAYVVTRGEPATSHVFSGGALTGLALAAIGILTSLTYWAIAGRYAGWRGDETEQSDAKAVETFHRIASAAKIERCWSCLIGGAAAALVVFALLAWVMIDGTGLRDRVIADAEDQAHAALKRADHGWATFTIEDGRGVISGKAPDELAKRAAHDTVREALLTMTGFPGVVSRIEDRSAAALPLAAVPGQVTEIVRRDPQELLASEEARRAAEAARATEEEARRRAEAQAARAEEQAAKAEARLAEKLEQERLAAEAEAQQRAAEALSEPAEMVKEDTPAAEVAAEQTVAALDAVAPTADEVGANPQTTPAGSCTDQDLAMVESSRVLFSPQQFDVNTEFERDLDLIAASVRACAPRPVQVTGHADTNADRLFNPALAMQRAEAVREGLIARGVAPTRIVTNALPFPFEPETGIPLEERVAYRRSDFKFLEVTELGRDATQGPDERAINCEEDLSAIMAKSIIHFPTASSRVSPESTGLILRLANAVKTCGSVIVTVEGHTDKVGTDAENQKLSEARASAVKDALIAVGADPTRLASHGFSSSRPFDKSETAEAYALNRRIEFRVSGKFAASSASGP